MGLLGLVILMFCCLMPCLCFSGDHRQKQVFLRAKRKGMHIEHHLVNSNLQDCRHVTIAFSNEQYSDIAMNWLLHLRHQNIHCHVLFGTKKLQDTLQQHGFTAFVVPLLQSKNISQLYITRYEYALAFLINGYVVHLSDIDAIPCSDMFDALKLYPSFDIAGGNGIYPYEVSFANETNLKIGSLNAGFNVIQNTTTAINIIVSTLLAPPKKLGGIRGLYFWDDQTSLNSVVVPLLTSNESLFTELEDGSIWASVPDKVSIVYLSRHRFPVSGFSWWENTLPTYCGNDSLNCATDGLVVLHPTLVKKEFKSKSAVLHSLGSWVLPEEYENVSNVTASNDRFSTNCVPSHFCTVKWVTELPLPERKVEKWHCVEK